MKFERIEKGGKLTNHTPIPNEIKRVFFDMDNDLNYGDFALYVYIAMHVQYSENGRNGKPNGKQGYCYKTKTTMRAELAMSKGKLETSIQRLIDYGFIETRTVANRYGGRTLLEYRLADVWKRYL